MKIIADWDDTEVTLRVDENPEPFNKQEFVLGTPTYKLFIALEEFFGGESEALTYKSHLREASPREELVKAAQRLIDNEDRLANQVAIMSSEKARQAALLDIRAALAALRTTKEGE